MEIKLGIYRHFKGNEYRVIGIAKHSETREDYVVYQPMYDNPDETMAVRPLAMFQETVDRHGYHGPRFTFVRNK